jgi:hypothetical protein
MATKPQIQYKNISHLFWGKYTHKVIVGVSTKRDRYGRSNTATAKRMKEELSILRHCPVDTTLWKSASHSTYVVVFLQTQEDANHLISNVKEQVLEVWQPVSDSQIKLLSEDHKIVVRDKLFYGTFDWCVTCHILNKEARRELIDWAVEYFSLEESFITERLHFSDGRHIKFYLREESDVLIVKIAQSDAVRKIEKVVLTNTLITEEQ